MKKNLAGFTLIELMIVVSVIGVLSAIAYSSYQSSVMKSNRSEAKAELSTVAGRLQSCYSMYGRYDDPSSTNLCAVYEKMENAAITSDGRGYYLVDLVAATTTTFTLKAVPIKTPQTKDKDCAYFEYKHTGAHTSKDKANADSTAKCW